MEPVPHRDGLVRLARRADVDGMARVHVRAWQVGYDGQMPADHLASLEVGESAMRWHSYFDLPPGRRTAIALVSENGDGVVTGIASYGEARGEVGAGELWMLNVHPDHWREGWGGALVDVVIIQLVKAGHTSSILWVVETNDRARAFYEAGGWAADGGVKTESIGSAEITEVRYRRSHQV